MSSRIRPTDWNVQRIARTVGFAMMANAAAFIASAQPSLPSNSSPLEGTSWQLVKFQGGDGKTLTPDDGSKYTIRMVKHWGYIRSYVLKYRHLFLSLMADGGIYEFEPIKRS